MFEGVVNYINVSQSMNKYITFDIIKSTLLFMLVFGIKSLFYGFTYSVKNFHV